MAIDVEHRTVEHRTERNSWADPRFGAALVGGLLASFGALALADAESTDWTEPATTLFGLQQSPLLSVMVFGVGMLMMLDAFDDSATGASLRLWGSTLAAIGLVITFGPFTAWVGATPATGITYIALGIGSMSVGSFLGNRADDDRTAEYELSDLGINRETQHRH